MARYCRRRTPVRSNGQAVNCVRHGDLFLSAKHIGNNAHQRLNLADRKVLEKRRVHSASFFQYLFKRALLRILVGAPAYEFGAMREAIAGNLIEPNFCNQFGANRLPLPAPFRAPSAGAAWRFAGKAGRRSQTFELSRQCWPVFPRDRRCKANVVEFALVIRAQAKGNRPRARSPDTDIHR